MIVEQAGWINCANCHHRLAVFEKKPLVCPECGAYNGLIEFKACQGPIDEQAWALRSQIQEKERAIRKMDALAGDARVRADLKEEATWVLVGLRDGTTWSRIAYACQHEAMALRWVNRALQARLDGGPSVNEDTDVFLAVAETLVELSQDWRCP